MKIICLMSFLGLALAQLALAAEVHYTWKPLPNPLLMNGKWANALVRSNVALSLDGKKVAYTALAWDGVSGKTAQVREFIVDLSQTGQPAAPLEVFPPHGVVFSKSDHFGVYSPDSRFVTFCGSAGNYLLDTQERNC